MFTFLPLPSRECLGLFFLFFFYHRGVVCIHGSVRRGEVYVRRVVFFSGGREREREKANDLGEEETRNLSFFWFRFWKQTFSFVSPSPPPSRARVGETSTPPTDSTDSLFPQEVEKKMKRGGKLTKKRGNENIWKPCLPQTRLFVRSFCFFVCFVFNL